LQPSDVGWFSHADPFEFDIHHFEYASDARRFWGGTPTVVPYVAAAASLRLMAGIGVPAIHAHNRRLIDAFLGALPEAWRTRIRTENIGGTLCIDTGAALQTIRQALTAAAVQFDCRGPVVRLSFHIYNTPEEALQIARAWEGAGRHSP
jgi:kynureninase